jgi:TonB family protein
MVTIVSPQGDPLEVAVHRHWHISTKECALKYVPSSRFLSGVVLFALLAVFSVGAFAEEGRKTKNEVKPAYPELARKMNLAGIVKVQVDIAPNGTVTSAKALGGHPLFIDAAVDAVRKWRFEPGPSATTQTVEFKFANPNGQ